MTIDKPNDGCPLPEALRRMLLEASERPEDQPQKHKDLGDGRHLVWTQFVPEPGRYYPPTLTRIRETVIVVETEASLKAGTSIPLLHDLAPWKKAAEGRFIVVYYPRTATPDRLCGLTPEATRLPVKDMIVEYEKGVLEAC